MLRKRLDNIAARAIWSAFIVGLICVTAMGCSGGSPITETETPSPSATTPTTPTTQTPSPSPTPTATPSPLNLKVLSPADGASVEIGAVRVLGKTRQDAAVMVNGSEVKVNAKGTFHHDVLLESGANTIKVVASGPNGNTVSESREVFKGSTSAALPLTLFYPQDGIEVNKPNITVTGGTRVDAVVGINGEPVDVNALGIFSKSVSLEEGSNVIEVVATDIDGNVRFQTAVVFYTP